MDVGFRAEGAYFKDRHYISKADVSIVSRDTIQFVAGADYNVSEHVYLNVLYSYDHVLDGGSLASRRATQQQLAGDIEWDLWDDTFSVELFALWITTDDSVYFNPTITWKPLDNLTLETGLNLLWAGKGDVLFPYRNNDSLFVSAKLFF
jgi:hypothetical protein